MPQSFQKTTAERVFKKAFNGTLAVLFWWYYEIHCTQNNENIDRAFCEEVDDGVIAHRPSFVPTVDKIYLKYCTSNIRKCGKTCQEMKTFRSQY